MSRLRTFIAVELSRTIRDNCVSLQQDLGRSGIEVKWVEPENLHVTLLFLGEVGDRDVPSICRAVSEVCAKHDPFQLVIQTVGCFPNPRRPRVIWVGATEGAQELCSLHDDLEPPLLELGCYRRENRKYTPHITLGRVKGEAAGHQLAGELATQASWEGGEIAVTEVQVLTSQLTPRGPVYAVLSRGQLGG